MEDSLRALCGRGTRVIRLDAYGYVTKKPGTRCFMEARALPRHAKYLRGCCFLRACACHRLGFQPVPWASLSREVCLVQEPEAWQILEDLEKIADEYQVRWAAQPAVLQPLGCRMNEGGHAGGHDFCHSRFNK